ncbi:Vitamin B12 ABC transporter, ATPase component BtuD [Olavius algarvensis associated proteobacterium Delta 3]|nr:Vitamin B12 ABC transporter, ATPase component BtuD [Olavius algarvensis associated proteobacterium Delta 3]CAB5164422.1 Vitamin B12 ABC transporter, ATPase component BtuD [Olavius algarvensis associated proteobacterium Delta 3]
MNAVDIHHLGYAYGSVPALQDLSFSVAEGELFCIIGPNGSGKTTLLKLIAGIKASPPEAVHIFGEAHRNYPRKALARMVAMVPQLVQEDFPFRVLETVLMGRTPHMGILGLEREIDYDIAAQAMAFTGVAHLAERTLDQLSGGEQQRVSIARAICQEPRVILLDEPTAALDLAHQIRIMDLMEKLKSEKAVSVVMVSHDINLAAMYADRVLLLKDGRRVGLGTPADVLGRELLEKTYGCRLLIDKSPVGNVPRVNLIPEKFS